MELKEAIELRASVRNFTDEPVSVEDLREMVRRAGLAPSENNHQPWKFTAITNRQLLRQMRDIVSKKIDELPVKESKRAYLIKSQMQIFATFFEKAPVVIAVSLTPQESILEKGFNITQEELNKLQNYPDLQSCGAAIQNILLSAVEMGYGACWMSTPLTAREELEKILNIKSPSYLAAFVTIGKPLHPVSQSNKKTLKEIFVLKD
ncbi:MAG TPA: nitroreductase family protein [Bacteroidia bacterium]|nr:hypothetical protein [Sphingobacteriales bacterium]HPD64404.1 nitroreductase family protein [Bacteroidia bacterium]HRU67000.1 nitroreductase family protein [Bacteroidia bacterium]